MEPGKMWYSSKGVVSLIAGILVLVYQYVQEHVMPGLPGLPDGAVVAIETFLLGTGIFGRVTAKKEIRKKLIALLLAFGVIAFAAPAHADLFGDRTQERKLKSSLRAEEPTENMNAPLVEWGSIADILAALSAKMGVKEGTFFDWKNEDFRNYLATTLYTEPNSNVAVNVGMIGTDGVLASLDWNVGSAISQEDVPILSLFQYLYVGYGIGYVDPVGDNTSLENTDGWEFTHGPTIVFKATF